MNKKILKYAQLHIDVTAKENNIRTVLTDNALAIETFSGKCYQLADKEILYQAEEYLLSEIESLRE